MYMFVCVGALQINVTYQDQGCFTYRLQQIQIHTHMYLYIYTTHTYTNVIKENYTYTYKDTTHIRKVYKNDTLDHTTT